MPASNTQQQLQFQVNPIILSGGAAAQLSGGMLPMGALLGMSFGNSGGGGKTALGLPYSPSDLDDAFGAFNVLPGGTLVQQTIAKYPFANQFVAANATIREPLTISVIMDAPARGKNALVTKQAIMTSLKATLDNHNAAGGTYTVVTPGYVYMDLIMTSLTDNSRGNNSLPQNAWRFDFEKPLVSLTELQNAQNLLMSKITNGLPTDGSQTGPQPGASAAQSNQSATPQSSSALFGPSTAVPYQGADTQNYPALMNPFSHPYSGIS